MSVPSKDNEDFRKLVPYVPGDLTDPYKRDDSYDDLLKQLQKPQVIEAPSSKGYPKYREDFSRQSPPPPKDLKIEADEMYNKHKELLTAEYKGQTNEKEKQRTPSPVLDAIRNFDLAKKLHKENLEHEPLPDTLTDALYRKLQMQKFEKDPGLSLPESAKVTGIGWKGYPGYGPTRCTKLKVYRPKTGLPEKHQEKRDGRPNSVSSFDKKWRFIRQSKVTPIELAIRWDLAPEDPHDEPKPPTHIDGSNGSLAPAVFTLVHTPKDDDSVKSSRRCSDVASSESNKKACEPVFEKLPQDDITNDALPFLNNRPKTTHGRLSNGSVPWKNRAQSAHNLQEMGKDEKHSDKDSQHSSNLSKKSFHKSAPNVSCANKCTQTRKLYPNARLCMACEMKNMKLKDKQPKQEYKMAFKAGVPQPQNRVSSFQKVKFLFTVPRQKDPYKKTKYNIDSLAAPFCLQKDKRTDYPDHWRLATVYQHSYKPIHLRKRPLLASIFK